MQAAVGYEINWSLLSLATFAVMLVLMPLFSEEIQSKSPDTQRRLYTLFQRAVNAGDLPALKLLTRFGITGSKGQERQVFDYAYTTSTAAQIREWLQLHEAKPNPKGVTVEDVKIMSDAQLAALIKAQRKPLKKRAARRQSSLKYDASQTR